MGSDIASVDRSGVVALASQVVAPRAELALVGLASQPLGLAELLLANRRNAIGVCLRPDVHESPRGL
jgi:hypothetical protein